MALRVVFRAFQPALVKALMALIALAVCNQTWAQEEVKRALFEDCDKAASEYNRLNEEERLKLLDLFVRVIALSTQSPSAPEAFAVAPSGAILPDGAPRGSIRTPDLGPGALWQMTDAKRELRAKRCALGILQSSGSSALGVLPSLVATYSEQVLSDEIAVNVEEVCAQIAEQSHNKGLAPSNEALISIIRLTASHHPLVARNVVQEYRELALPLVIREIATSKLTLPATDAHWLSELDPNGSRGLRALIDLVPELTPAQIKTALEVLPLPNKATLKDFVPDLLRLASQVELQDSFLPLLGSTCVELSGLALDPNQHSALAQISRVFDAQLLAPLQAACLARSSPALGRKASELLAKNSSTENQKYGLEIIARVYPSLGQEAKREAYTAVSSLAFDQGYALSTEALNTLASFTDQRSEINQAIYNALKASSKAAPESANAANYSALLNLLNAIGLDRDPQRFMPFIMAGVRTTPADPAAKALAAKMPTLDREIIKLALSTPPNQNSVEALDILSQRRDLPASIAPQLTELLKFTELQPKLEATLITIGRSAVAALRKSSGRSASPSVKLSALFTLAQLKAATEAELKELLSVSAAQTDCAFTSAHPKLFCLQSGADKIDQGINQALSSELQRCLASLSTDGLRQIMECAPRIVNESATAALKTIDLNRDEGWLQQLATIATEIQPQNPDTQKLLSALLQRGSSDIKQRILTRIDTPAPISDDMRAAIRAQAQATPTSSPLQLSALKALALHADRDYDWPEFIKQAIEGAGKGQLDREAGSVIALIPEEIVLSEVIPALESDDSDKLIGAALVGSALGSKAIAVVSRLWNLRDHRDPTVRFAVTLALLRINPLTPDLSEPVRKLLVNRFFPLALNIPIDWPKTVAVNDLDKASLGTLRKDRLDRLLITASQDVRN